VVEERRSFMKKDCDSSWDPVKSAKGNLPRNSEALDKKYAEWEKRKWFKWPQENLSFPFTVKRMEDDDDAYLTNIAKKQPFRLGHTMKVLGIEDEEDLYGIIIKCREGRKIGHIPLCDVEVTPKEDPNYWPVREYAICCLVCK
jgi:hypothetical protein